MTDLRNLVDADAACGGKALGLARAIAAGLRVPDGFVIGPAVFAELAGLGAVEPDAIGHALDAAARRIAEAALPAALAREVEARAAALGRLAVRSSASVEDAAGSAAAGVFESWTDVAPGDVWRAVRAVWTSALTPLAVGYARRHAHAIAIAVIVQRFVPGERITVYTRPIGAPTGDAVWLQRGEAIEKRARGDGDELVAIARAAEAAIDAPRGADVELVRPADGGAPWLVQARPIVHPVRAARTPPPPIVIAPLVTDGRRWSWDITHNPDPLSPAQAGLVAAVDRAAASPYVMRVCGGYLYTTPARDQPAVAPPADADELRARIAAIEARFALEPDGPADDLGAAIDRYVAFVRIWAWQLSPLIATARRVLLDRLARDGH
ncbi:MAG TPA: PEP/pyruvate-binding domain-containing protein, partial [Kofleriaceae bacterium]|nr:PEP/pyruvate-binding domain-containing protein [Kofleriaceae bacterium]